MEMESNFFAHKEGERIEALGGRQLVEVRKCKLKPNSTSPCEKKKDSACNKPKKSVRGLSRQQRGEGSEESGALRLGLFCVRNTAETGKGGFHKWSGNLSENDGEGRGDQSPSKNVSVS